MKLTKIALSVVAVAAVAVIGGSWYTGKQVEEQYQQIISQANSELAGFGKQFGGKFAIQDVQIERHFFSSDAKYRLVVENKNGEKVEFVGNDKLYHGPFPLNRLAEFKFTPLLMSVESHTQSPEQLKKWIGEKLGSGVANISYSGNTDGEFTFSPMKFDDKNNIKLDVSELKIRYNYDQNVKNVKGSVNLADFAFKTNDTEGQIQGIDYLFQTDNDQGYSHLGLGEGKLTVKTVEIKDTINGDGTAHIKDISASSKNSLNGDRFVASQTVQMAALKINDINVGKADLDLMLDLDAPLTNQIVQNVTNPEQLAAMEYEIKQLLAKSPKLHLNNLSFTNPQGKMQTALVLNLNNLDLSSQADLKAFLDAFSASKWTASIDRSYIEEMIRQAMITEEKLPANEAAIQAKAIAAERFLNLTETGIFQLSDDKVSAELLADSGKVTLNGQVLSESEIQTGLFILMMNLGLMGL